MNLRDVTPGEDYAVRTSRGSIRRMRAVEVDVAADVCEFVLPGHGSWKEKRGGEFVLRPWAEHQNVKRELGPARDAVRDALNAAGLLDAQAHPHNNEGVIVLQLNAQDAHTVAELMARGLRAGPDSALDDLLT